MYVLQRKPGEGLQLEVKGVTFFIKLEKKKGRISLVLEAPTDVKVTRFTEVEMRRVESELLNGMANCRAIAVETSE